ncbi:MAG TPA: hypothetical protein VGR89_08605, partial [Puia sp.]|nr:hypothetical protein [Puia sp.]
MLQRLHRQNLIRWELCLAFGFGLCGHCRAQDGISGPTCVVNGTQYTYTITGNWTNSTTMTWTVTNGTISGNSSGTPLPQVHITWNTPTTGTVHVSTSNPSGSASLTVSSAATLNGGSITNPSQTIYYNTVPQTLVCPAAQGGSCGTPNYVYQWQSSPNNTTFSNISAATSGYLTFTTGLTSTTYYRRMVTETTSGTTAYSTTATVFVYPQVVIGAVTPSSKSINYGVSPGTLSSSGATGGDGSPTYEWQSSPDNVNWTTLPYSGATSLNPGPLGSTTYFRICALDGPTFTASAATTITVGAEVFPGTIAPSNITLLSGGLPGLLSGNPASGGACGGSFTYQWQSSTDGFTWNNISAATSPTYLPGAIS